MKRLLLVLLVLAALVLLLVWGRSKGNADAPQKAAVPDTTPVVLRDIEEIVESIGEVKPVLQTDIKSEINGRIAQIFVEQGESVEQGQILVELVQTNVQAQLEEAERHVQTGQLRLEQAQRRFDRLAVLRQRDFAMESEFQDAQTELNVAKLDLEIRQNRLQQRQKDMEDTLIRAPHDGVILDLTVNEGQVIVGANSVSNGTTLMRVADLTKLYVQTEFNEVDISRVERGAAASISFDSFPGLRLSGVIAIIAPSANQRNNLRVFPVEVAFEERDSRVRPGISARVGVMLSRASQVPAVLISGVFSRRGESYVFVVLPGGGVERRTVKTGISDTQYVQIVEGLVMGETVRLTRPPGMR